MTTKSLPILDLVGTTTTPQQQLQFFHQNHTRTLIDGSKAVEFETPIDIHIRTKCPRKWLHIDAETGQVWQWNPILNEFDLIYTELKTSEIAIRHRI